MRKTFLLIMPFLLSTAFAVINPNITLSEIMTNTYYPNGSLNSTSGSGRIRINSPGNEVLQYVRVSLSSASNTNLQSKTAYKGIVSGLNNVLYHNTTLSSMDSEYLISDFSNAPLNINLSLDYFNTAGGRDVFSTGNNTFVFNLTVNSSSQNPINLSVQFFKDAFGINDAVNISSAGFGSVIDTDSDGWNDLLTANFTLNKSLQFTAVLGPGINFNETSLKIKIGDEFVDAETTSAYSVSGNSIDYHSARGDVREGVDSIIDAGGDWKVRGFIQSLADDLNYTVFNWSLINVNSSSVDLSYSGSIPWTYLISGQTAYTDWLETGSADKFYYSPFFNWSVSFDSAINQSRINSRILGFNLYEIDLVPSKNVALIYYDEIQDVRILQVNDSSKHTGHSSLTVNNTVINSVIPHASEEGNYSSWNVSDVLVYYKNITGVFDITSTASIIVVNATISTDGFVKMVTNKSVNQNEEITLSYEISSSTSNQTQTFVFTGNSTMTTDSGTPVTKEISKEEVIGRILELWQFPLSPYFNESIIIYARSDSSQGINITVRQNNTVILESPMSSYNNAYPVGYFEFLSDVRNATKDFLPLGVFYYNVTIGPFSSGSNISYTVGTVNVSLDSYAEYNITDLLPFRKSFLYDTILDWEDNYTHSPLMQYRMPNPSFTNINTYGVLIKENSVWNTTTPIISHIPFSEDVSVFQLPDLAESGDYIYEMHVNDGQHFILRYKLAVIESSINNANNEIDDVTHKRRNDPWAAQFVHTNRIDKLTWIRRNV